MKICGEACCPGQQGFAEELSAVPLSFDIMPKMLKKGGYRTHMLGKVRAANYSGCLNDFYNFILC